MVVLLIIISIFISCCSALVNCNMKVSKLQLCNNHEEMYDKGLPPWSLGIVIQVYAKKNIEKLFPLIEQKFLSI